MNLFKLRFKKDKIIHYSSRYSYPKEDKIVDEVMPRVISAGYLSNKDFLSICDWKTQRTKSHCRKNSPAYIKEITKISLNTKEEKLRITILTLLQGVNWPTASTILHFCTNYRYPILDFRALWSLKCDPPRLYTFDFWWSYTKFCRQLAKDCGVDLRILDKALWQYSKEKQVI